MKHQYFGDVTDLFKYDLLINLYKDLSFDQITFGPMLTENDGRKDGSKREYERASAGTRNKQLISFLKQFSEVENRNAIEIQKHLIINNIPSKFYSTECFSHKNRKHYFAELFNSKIENQLLLFDPDNGMQIKRSNHKHILYEEIKNCLQNSDDNTVISTIQFRHRFNWVATVERKLGYLKDTVSSHVTFIRDNNIAFYFITKERKTFQNVNQSLKKYKDSYSNLRGIED